MATGRMIRLMDLVPILTQMAPNIKETGKTISSTVRALKHGLMVIVTMVATWMTRKMDRVNLNGLMVAPIRGASTRMTFREKVLMMTSESLFNRHLSVE
jgi:hypothetical protein